MSEINKDVVSKSWFCVFNNPHEHGYSEEPSEVCEKLKDEWIEGHPTRTGAWTYCISASGLRHVHMVLEDVRAMRFSAVKKSYALGMHFEPTKGNKEQAEAYINKQGHWKEKGEQIIHITRHGEIKGAQGSRRDLEVIEDLINSGYTPRQIMDMNISYRRYEKFIRDAYFEKRAKEVPFKRDVNVIWHVGKSGSGKSYTANKLVEKYGEEYIYFITDYENGCFDRYCAEPVLFMDEFRGQVRYSTLLTWLDGYKIQVHARYSNVIPLWSEVHITSVKAPDMVYKDLITSETERIIDTFEQLRRRIDTVVYHWRDDEGYHEYSMPMSEYIDYKDLENRALGKYEFREVTQLELRIFEDDITD